LSVDTSSIQADDPLPSLGIDSMSFVEILLLIEETYGLRLIETDLKKEDFQTIRSMATCINKLI
jgi:acyl carrier protein